MSTRRDFLGFLGNVCFVGGVVYKEGLGRPALALPKWITPVLTREPAVPDPILHPLLTAAGSQANAMMQIRAGLPDSYFLEMLEGNLRSAKFFAGRDDAVVGAQVKEAVAGYGSIIAARRAGAL